MAKIKNIFLILLSSSILLTFALSVWAGGCCSKGSHEEGTPIIIATKPLSIAGRGDPSNAFGNEDFYSFKTGAFNKDRKTRRIIFVPTDLTSTQEAPSGTIHEIMEHADLMQLVFSFTEVKDIKALILVSKDFNKILLGDGEENSLPWKIWIKKYNISVPQGRSYRDTLKGHLYLVNSIADAYRLEFESAVSLCDKACDYRIQEAIERRLRGYSEEKYGYPKDLDKVFKLNEELIAVGNQKAIFRRIIGHAKGEFGYPKDPQKAFILNEELVAAGNHDSLELSILGYDNGDYGYPKDPNIAFKLNEKLADEGNRDALRRRALGYAVGKFGYAKDTVKAVEIFDKLVEEGDEDAIKIKITGYQKGTYGYSQDYLRCQELIIRLARKGSLTGIQFLTEGYINGWYGFPQFPQGAYDFNERRVKAGNKEVIKRAIEGYAYGRYGYPEHIPNAVKLLKSSLVIPNE